MDELSPEMAEAAARHLDGANIAWGHGQVYNLADPNPEVVTIEDVAFALAYTVRWRGQTRHDGKRVFYGVGQHVVFGTEEMMTKGYSRANCLSFLMHEMDEVPLPDMPGPAKNLIPGFREVAKRNAQALLNRFGVLIPNANMVKAWDMRMMVTEKRDLMPGHEGDRFHTSDRVVINEAEFPPFDRKIVPYAHPDMAAERFLALWQQLRP